MNRRPNCSLAFLSAGEVFDTHGHLDERFAVYTFAEGYMLTVNDL